MSTIQGVNRHDDANSHVFHITNFSDELKRCISKHLRNICHGKSLASQNLSLHNYKNTLNQFRNRYLNKTSQQKKGIMGELLSHVLIHEFLTSYDVISPFFNMEEKSQRKGFDLILTSKSDHEVWITEVKSGELGQKPTPNHAIKSFLSIGKSDLNLRLNQEEETFWQNAINSAFLAISDCTDYKDAVVEILSSEGVAAMSGTAVSTDNNVILISVLFHETNNLFDAGIGNEVALNIKGENLFKNIITFSVQQDTYQQIETFLFEEELD